MKLSGGWHGDLEAGGAAFEPVVNFRVAHLSRCVTGGAFDFGSSSDLNVTYDSSNNVLSESIPLDGAHTATTSYTYNSFGEVLTVSDPLGRVTTNVYDMHGNLTSVTSPARKLQADRILTNDRINSKGLVSTWISNPPSLLSKASWIGQTCKRWRLVGLRHIDKAM
jgi:YD repeat-containing protein